MNRIFLLTVFFFFVPILSCDSQNKPKNKAITKAVERVESSPPAKTGRNVEQAVKKEDSNNKQYTFEIVRTLPHDPAAFTQGLIYHKGYLYESTGLRGESTLRKIDPMAGNILKMEKLAPHYFSEGITILGNRIYMLTYVSQVCLVFNLETLKLETTISYDGEGWGLAHDGEVFIMSDGSNFLRFLRPENFEVTRGVGVYDKNGPVRFLNEMEFINGEIYSNVWQQDEIVRIDPISGDVRGRIDFSSLPGLLDNQGSAEVFNGIAYNPDTNTFFVTGKYWDKLFEIKLIEKK